MDPRAGMDGCGTSRPHRDSIPGPFSPQRVAIPTALSRLISKNNYISHFMKINAVGAELFHDYGGKTDTTHLIVAFSNFANALERSQKL